MDDEDGGPATLRTLVALRAPDAESVRAATDRIRVAVDRVNGLARDDVRSADQVASLLRAALHHHEGRDAVACPVCRQGTLDAAWRTDAAARADALEQAATALRAATAELDNAVAAARGLILPVPGVLRGSTPIAVDEVFAR